jgi:pyruvoyl-dependent arginine decarboxylase (PvlArgDC)
MAGAGAGAGRSTGGAVAALAVTVAVPADDSAEGLTTESQSFEIEPQPANRATHKSTAGVLMKFKLDLLSRMSVGLRVEPSPAIDI